MPFDPNFLWVVYPGFGVARLLHSVHAPFPRKMTKKKTRLSVFVEAEAADGLSNNIFDVEVAYIETGPFKKVLSDVPSNKERSLLPQQFKITELARFVRITPSALGSGVLHFAEVRSGGMVETGHCDRALSGGCTAFFLVRAYHVVEGFRVMGSGTRALGFRLWPCCIGCERAGTRYGRVSRDVTILSRSCIYLSLH